MRRPFQLAIALGLGLAIIPAAALRPAGAQPVCAPASRALQTLPVAANPLMERRISLHGRDVSLRDVLDRVAAASRIHISYSSEALDLSRSVCLDYEYAPLGRILAELLGEDRVRPVVFGADQVVLTPSLMVTSTEVPVPIMKQIGVLDRVVVTGSTVTSERGRPFALSVLEAEQLAQRAATSLSGALDGVVPGVWLWEQSPLNLLARYGSIRGASSFGVSYPKVYVDGVEVANSLLVTHLDPESISRIEVIRGPQGGALYGADAISGVMNIVTNHDGLGAGAPRAQIRSEGGTSASDYAVGTVVTQSHAISLRTGNSAKSAHAGMTVTTIGPFIPGASSQQIAGSGGMRFVRSRGAVTGTFRLFARDASTPASPVLFGAALDSSGRQSVRQYTIGTTGTFAQNDRWTHSAVMGFDGYRLRSATPFDGVLPSPLDSALRAATGNALRTTLRASSVGQFGDRARAAATVTLAAEHSYVRDETMTQNLLAPLARETGQAWSTESRSNVGLIGQINAGFHETFFLTGGLRVERNTGLSGVGEISTLPMVGASAVRAVGPTLFKLRAAYGKGIRPPQISLRAGTALRLNGSLSPEQQSGIEAGADIYFGKVAALHATRFDQSASGLLQPVSIFAASADANGPAYRHMAYELQNIGKISNRGWELEGSLGDGPWMLGATFSQVDSRVRKLAGQYTGDLGTGDRMLEVPARTFGVNALYAERGWSMSWRVSRASDWINYDRLALLSAFSSENSDVRSFIGPELRPYWRNYAGVTRIGGRLGMEVRRGMTLTLDGENLLDQQRGEPDNVTILPGRTISAGLRLHF